MKISANAKLNLALKITGRRADGYHTLDMIMKEISLKDFLDVKKAETVTVKASCFLPAENTITKACALFFGYTGIKGGATVNIKKNIPSGAGLGGGSSDGAAVLKALDKLYETRLSESELISLGVKIGADVPFFIKGGCARATGVGEILKPVGCALDCALLLAKPKKGVNTAAAYGVYDEIGGCKFDMDAAVSAVEAGDIRAFCENAGNDLYPSALKLCPQISEILELIKGEAAFMTGSGSCCFGVFSDKKAARERFERLKNERAADFLWLEELQAKR